MCRWMQETQKEAGLIALREHEAKSLKMVGCLHLSLASYFAEHHSTAGRGDC